jgi:membrane fusion protein, hemolysin D
MKPADSRVADRKGVVLALRPSSAAERQEQLEFLPAALEIVETPVSPVGHAMAGLIMLLFAIAIGWATFGHVDVIATATGKVVPTGRSKVIQPLEAGIVTAIHVRDGDHVAVRDVLIELDHTLNSADRRHVANDLLSAQLDVARLSALRAGIEAGTGPIGFKPPEGAPDRDVARTHTAMAAQASEQAAKVAAIERQIAQKREEADGVAATIAKLEASLPLVQREAEIRRKAMEIEYGNQIAYLEAARDALERQREQVIGEYTHSVLNDLSDAEKKAAELTEDLVKADQKLEQQVLRAPVDGTVQQLAVHTIGGVVTPAQQLMMIVPLDSHLEVEAMVSNRDVGFVHPGEAAEIKVDTFSFTRYGLLHGEVVSVSQDSIIRDKAADKSGNAKPGALAETSEPAGQELLYAARVSLDRTQMQIEDKLVSLTAGMAVTAEIKTGQRRVIECLLSPLLRYKQESLRER